MNRILAGPVIAAAGLLVAGRHRSGDRGPRGPVLLHVGEHSARDGTWEGVAIELDMR